jgi:hypothetical protein
MTMKAASTSENSLNFYGATSQKTVIYKVIFLSTCCKFKTLDFRISPWCLQIYSGSKITEILGNVTVRGEKHGKSKGERDCQQSL